MPDLLFDILYRHRLLISSKALRGAAGLEERVGSERLADADWFLVEVRPRLVLSLPPGRLTEISRC